MIIYLCSSYQNILTILGQFFRILWNLNFNTCWPPRPGVVASFIWGTGDPNCWIFIAGVPTIALDPWVVVVFVSGGKWPVDATVTISKCDFCTKKKISISIISLQDTKYFFGQNIDNFNLLQCLEILCRNLWQTEETSWSIKTKKSLHFY